MNGIGWNNELLQALVAGWVSGAVAGLAATAAVLIFLARRPAVARRLPWQQRLPILGIIFANAFLFGLTIIGLVLGALFHRAGGPEAPVRFGIGVGAGVLVIATLYAVVRGRLRSGEAPGVLACLAVCGLCFGVLLPFLGSLDR